MTTITMNITIFDTLAFSKRMQKAGLKQETADELAEAIKETQTQSIESFVTKTDLENEINHSESIPNYKSIDRINFIFLVKTKAQKTSCILIQQVFWALVFPQKSFVTAINRFVVWYRLEIKTEASKNEMIIRISKMIYLATGLIIGSIGLAVAILKI